MWTNDSVCISTKPQLPALSFASTEIRDPAMTCAVKTVPSINLQQSFSSSGPHQFTTTMGDENVSMIRYDFNKATGKFEEQHCQYAGIHQAPHEMQQMQMQLATASYSTTPQKYAQVCDPDPERNVFYRPSSNMRAACLMSVASHSAQSVGVGTVSAKSDVTSLPALHRQLNDVTPSSCMVQQQSAQQQQPTNGNSSGAIVLQASYHQHQYHHQLHHQQSQQQHHHQHQPNHHQQHHQRPFVDHTEDSIAMQGSCAAVRLQNLARGGATIRERNRMHMLNDAFEDLRRVVPRSNLAEHQKLSKIATLRLAIHYIGALANVLETCGVDVGAVVGSAAARRSPSAAGRQGRRKAATARSVT